MGMKPIRYKLKNRTIRTESGDRIPNDNHNVVILSGVWCSKKKKDLELGPLTWREFKTATGILTCARTDPRGNQRRWVEEHKWQMLQIMLTAGESVELEVRRIR